jgi:hypothetical protein
VTRFFAVGKYEKWLNLWKDVDSVTACARGKFTSLWNDGRMLQRTQTSGRISAVTCVEVEGTDRRIWHNRPRISTDDNESDINMSQCKRIMARGQTDKLRGLSPQTKYTDRVTAAYRRSWCQLLQIENAT